MPEFDYRTNRFWSMIDSIKRYVAETGHKVSSHDDAKTRTIGFISTENAPARMLDGSGFYGWRSFHRLIPHERLKLIPKRRQFGSDLGGKGFGIFY